ncbi:MAG: alpha-2-macroglobulin [Culturomica sp.]|nr:alpha-2-macroglobulin [Culturomica sp.]
MLFKRIHLLFPVICLLAFAACQRSSSGPQQPDIRKYIYGYTSGTITSGTPIEILLEQAPAHPCEAGEVLPEKILRISPAVKGKLYLQEKQTLVFVPDDRFENGREYTFKLHLDALLEVPREYRTFEFGVKILPLRLSFSGGNLVAESNSDSLRYEGELQASDFMEAEAVEKELSASLEGAELTATWQHTGNTHRFQTGRIAKTDQPRIMKLTFGKLAVHIPAAHVTIPGRNQFTVLNIQLNDNNRNFARIDFSEPVDPSQSLEGLISIKGISDLRFQRENNTVFLYYTTQPNDSEIEVTVHEGIRSSGGKTLTEAISHTLKLPSTRPAVKFIGQGAIVPSDGRILVPFSAVALKSVDVQIIKVFRQNMHFFLQENAYDGGSDLMRTARPVFRKKIDLVKEGEVIDLTQWNDYTLNLPELIELEKGVIYRVEIRFRRSYTTLECAGEGEEKTDYYKQDWDGNSYYYSDYYYNNSYRWEERDDPCTDSYYTGSRFISRNIIHTSLGIVAKRGTDNRYFVAVNDIATARPVSNCRITLYDYQNNPVDSAQTDKNGFARLNNGQKGFMVTASKENDKAWLKVADATSLSLSNFDVGGQNVQTGLKGFIYGERGVWRPGDDLYLSFILEDKQQVLPAGHPVMAELYNPQGNLVSSRKSVTGENPIHTFRFSTDAESPTGYWSARVKIGGSVFSKTIRIETVKPNRFSIALDFPDKEIVGSGVTTNQIVRARTRWLNGTKAPNRKAETEVRISNGNFRFREFPSYSFQNPADAFEPYTAKLYEGTTDAEGNFSFSLNKISVQKAPGVLNASFTTRLFEEGSDFSIATYTTNYSPYNRYVGIRLPESPDNWYSTREPVRLQGVVVTPKGQKSAGAPRLQHIKVYKIDWRWWWDAESNGYGSYIRRSANNLVWEQRISAQGGEFSLPIEIKQYGRYYIEATDRESGHTAGLIAYFGSWAESNSAEIATLLQISADKPNYKAGEKIRLKVPSSQGGTIIFSLENGTSFQEIRRVEATTGETEIEIEATAAMCPNIYAHITLIQPQNQRDNDRPVRLYGVLNIPVEEPSLHLQPELETAAELRPGEEFSVTVREQKGQAMSYTLAVVDEGLLSITSFRTPDPFPAFYAREALGVKTWDFYDYLFGAYGARLEKAFAVGGDETLKAPQDEKTNRFKPVALFDGPFSLKKGETRTHKFRMPEYIGEVRTMLVAATADGKYGSAETSSFVKKPLMISAAMPRLFTPGDVVEIPVTVFAMEKSVREVKVELTANDLVEPLSDRPASLTFSEPGEQTCRFNVRIRENTGKAQLTFTARSGKERAAETTDVEVRVPNPRITQSKSILLESGAKETFDTEVSGADPAAVLEISTIPPLNLSERLNTLLTYPHGCGEQIVSGAFPQVALGQLLPLTSKQKLDAENNVKSVIERLGRYQTAEGGFAYWPGNLYTSEWVSIYAAHFLIAAGKQGYHISGQLLEKDLRYLKSAANGYRITSYYHELVQGYRLYVLALGGQPELAAMNRMKERSLQNTTARWLLASAYALSNHPEIAREMTRNAGTQIDPYRETGGSFGSDIRDKAIILQSAIYQNRQEEAYRLLEDLSTALSSNRWMSTQTIAFALVAATEYVEKFVGKNGSIEVEIRTGGKRSTAGTDKTFWQETLSIKEGRSTVEVKNNSQAKLYVRQVCAAAPFGVVAEEQAAGLSMQVRYTDRNDQSVDIDAVPQGMDVTAAVTIRNTGQSGTYYNLALNYLLPSGFEIINDRLTGNTQAFTGADHTDIRDDRYYVYFSLEQGQSKTFRFRFNCAFPGTYLRPAIRCSAMYDDYIQAVLPGGKTVITR